VGCDTPTFWISQTDASPLWWAATRVGQRLEHAGHALGLGGRKLRRAKRRAGKLNRGIDESRRIRHGLILTCHSGAEPPIWQYRDITYI